MDDSLHFLEVIHRTPIDAFKKEVPSRWAIRLLNLPQAALHKGKLARARDTALTVGEQICTLRERAYYLARERQIRLEQKTRLEKSLVKSIEAINQEQELQVCRLLGVLKFLTCDAGYHACQAGCRNPRIRSGTASQLRFVLLNYPCRCLHMLSISRTSKRLS